MLTVQFISSIDAITCNEWNDLCRTEFPFIRHEFLSALEQTHAVSIESGWTPMHLLIYDVRQLVAVMPGYLKDHSYGEFVFDFQWAAAYQRSALHYYPKYISAIPFSPATGPRLCIRAGYDSNEIVKTALQAIKQLVSDKQLSSWHLLFPEQGQANLFANLGLPQRTAVHFQWFNNDYQQFDDFLETFNSRKRKNLRKERQKIAAQGIVLQRIEGHDITDDLWECFYHFYQTTYLKRSGHSGYLDKKFFQLLGKNLPGNLLMVIAHKNGNIIAGALNLKDSTTLYGRYWGCYNEYDFLHFETCYYQGIEYCIEKKLQRFDPGVQGEHKIQRGFKPVYTYSNHWIADAHFRSAITEFLTREARHIAIYKQQAEELLPFKH
jgi:predicted N-acyltransferase